MWLYVLDSIFCLESISDFSRCFCLLLVSVFNLRKICKGRDFTLRGITLLIFKCYISCLSSSLLLMLLGLRSSQDVGKWSGWRCTFWCSWQAGGRWVFKNSFSLHHRWLNVSHHPYSISWLAVGRNVHLLSCVCTRVSVWDRYCSADCVCMHWACCLQGL